MVTTKNLIPLMLFVVFCVAFTSCSSYAGKVRGEIQRPEEDEFFQGTQLIMLKSEAKIYMHLPDEAAKLDFIEEFWQKRDPNPETEENEVRLEYEQRLEYVNRWFREKVGNGRGAESDRGKLYLLLGAPDERSTRNENIIDRLGRPMRVLKEIWIYSSYQLYLEFVDADGFGIYRLAEWTPDLLTAIERAKFSINPQENNVPSFRFKAKFEASQIKISIPVKAITFNDNGTQMATEFNITVFIYFNYRRIDTLTFTRSMEGTKEDFLARKNILFNLPYFPASTGRYVFDIIVEDVFAKNRYREMLEYEQR